MDDFGIFDPRLVRRVKEDWERAKTEVRRATAPILNEAERVFEGVLRPSPPGRPRRWMAATGSGCRMTRRRCASVSNISSPT